MQIKYLRGVYHYPSYLPLRRWEIAPIGECVVTNIFKYIVNKDKKI